MSALARMVVAACVLMPGVAAAQVYKCTDATGKTSYTSAKCSDLGLKEVGEVGDRINVSPAYRPPAGYRRAPPAPAEPPRQAQQPAATEEEKPERRCFTTAKGTRCNDKPEDDAPAETPR